MSADQSITIGVDARLCGNRHAGIGRYIQNLLVELVCQKPKAVRLVFFFHDQKQEQALQQALSKNSQYTAVYVPIRHYSLAEQLRWPMILQKYQLDLLHIPHFNIPLLYSGKIVITIHDLLWHEQIGPEATTLSASKYYLKYLAYRVVTNQALRRAEKIFVPTKTVKNTLKQHYAPAQEKTVVTYEGISDAFLQVNQRLQKKPVPDSNNKFGHYLIYVGSLYPHKNIDIVLQALQLEPQLKLKIVCARNVFLKRTQQKIQELNLEQQVSLTGYVSDEKLITLMQSALALIQPSKSEGFGLTAIEAMAVGTPVIASSLPVFEELYLDAPHYFDPDDAPQLLTQVKQLQQPSIRKQAIHKGLQLAQKYRWQTMAQQTLTQYLSVI